MPRHPFAPARGRLAGLTIESEALRGNRLGDPSQRSVLVYLPPGYAESDARYPLFVDLAGWDASSLQHTGWQAFGESVPQRIERLVAAGAMGPTIVAFPDCFTSLGGNQYVDSEVMGGWSTFLAHELVPQIEACFRVRQGRKHRAVYGKSSGGYGALLQGMRNADVWGGVACHGGDMGFEWVYQRDFPRMLQVLAAHGHDVPRFLDHVRARPRLADGERHTLMLLALSASYAPDPAAPLGIQPPVDPRTCALDDRRWQRWLSHDPVRLVERPDVQRNLRQLGGLFIDCGTQDQYFVQYGARIVHDRLGAAGIAHQYQEFEGDHGQLDERLDVSLPFLYRTCGGG
jgi:S-formylglutathione hydrolase FrmB